MDAFIQFRKIYDPNDEENTKVPTMPLIIALDNNKIYEARSVRGAASAVIGSIYLDAEDSIDEWNLRVDCARIEAMKALANDVNVVVYDNRYGIIKNNYAAADYDPDYIDDDAGSKKSSKLHVETDRLFLLSLLTLKSIKILERDDSYIFRNSQLWSELHKNGGVGQCCEKCFYLTNDGSGHYCSVYNYPVTNDYGINCSSFNISLLDFVEEYKGGNYIDLSEYPLDKLVTQDYIIGKK